MTRVLVWKESREQGTIVAALLVTGCGLIAGVSIFAAPNQGSRSIDTLFAMGVVGVTLLAIAAGAVIGATLFAGEREAGTFPFLDRLPLTRRQLWGRKVAVGLGLTAVPAVGYSATALATGQIDGGVFAVAGVFGGGTFFGFAWGCVGSVLRRTALGACAVGLSVGVVVTAISLCFPPLVLSLLQEVLPDEWRGSLLAQLAAVGSALVPLSAAFVAPLALSARLFTAPDREQTVASYSPVSMATGSRFSQVNRFAWLLARQHRGNAIWLTAVAAVLGCVLLIPDVLFIIGWPAATLVIGVLVGVVLFADEQGSESARFWGERRLRVGGVWGAKLAFGFALTLGLVVLMLLPCVARGFADSSRPEAVFSAAFRTGVASPGFPFFAFLFVGPAYGLAVGQLAALLFRKPIVALAVGTMLGGTAVALWFPSLFGGGLHGWQVFTPVAVTLVVSRLLTWPWATDTLGQRGPILRLAAGLVAVALTFAGGIAWRVLEVPEVAEANDDIAFAQSLPTYEQNESGRDLRRAVADFGGQAVPDLGPPAATDNNGRDIRTPNRVLSDELFDLLLRTGYPTDRPEVDEFLKRYDGDWEKTLLEMSRKPTGVYLDPTATPGDYAQTQPVFQRMVAAYALRGLKAQRDGDPADFVRRVGVLLAVVRTARTSGPPVAVLYANAVEEATFRGVQHWLQGLRGHPELLRQMLTTLLDHERIDTYTPRRTELASQVEFRNITTGAGTFSPRSMGLQGGPSREESDVIVFAWAVPWERERLRRAVGYGNAPAVGSARQANPYLRGAPGLWIYDFLRASLSQFTDNDRRIASFRGCLLRVALRLHEAETGRFPATLSELVPKYLPAVPLDPFAFAPFGYRLSVAGESLELNPPEMIETALERDAVTALGALTGSAAFGGLETPDGPGGPRLPRTDPQQRSRRELAAGQPIVWSVGPDRRDDGGKVSIGAVEVSRTSVSLGDMVFVVPLPAKAKSP